MKWQKQVLKNTGDGGMKFGKCENTKKKLKKKKSAAFALEEI